MTNAPNQYTTMGRSNTKTHPLCSEDAHWTQPNTPALLSVSKNLLVATTYGKIRFSRMSHNLLHSTKFCDASRRVRRQSLAEDWLRRANRRPSPSRMSRREQDGQAVGGVFGVVSSTGSGGSHQLRFVSRSLVRRLISWASTQQILPPR